MSYESRELSVFGGAPVECYKFTKVASQWLFTDSDEVASIPQGTFAPEVISRGNIRQDNEKGAGSVDVSLAADNSFAAQFIPYLPTSIVFLAIYRFHRGDADVFTVFNGEVSSARLTKDGEVILFCTPLAYRMGKRIPSTTFQSRCNHATYSVWCGADKNDFKLIGPVSAVVDDTISCANFAAQPDQWLRNGWVERIDGDRRFILDHIGTTIVVDAPFLDLAPGEAITAYGGDERTEEVCNTKFNRLPNYLGFQRVPTRNPFDGITEWTLGSDAATPRPPMFRRG